MDGKLQDTIVQYVQEQLFQLQDLDYRDFHSKLMPTVDKSLVIGVRTPALRKFAKEFGRLPEAKRYLHILPHKYYEENNLHGCLIQQIKDYQLCVDALNQFLPYVDNWATCDLMSPKILKRHLLELKEQIPIWLDSENPFTVRFGMKMLMTFYLDESFDPLYLQWVSQVHSHEYYVNMMAAWYYATALAKQYEATLPYLKEQKLDKWVHNKTIQKAVESDRITQEQKLFLKTLKI